MKHLKYTLAAASLLALAACSNEEEALRGTYANDPAAVLVEATIGAPMSRANTEAAGDRFVYDADAPEVIYVENTGDGKVAGKASGHYALQADGTWAPCNADGTPAPADYMVWGSGQDNAFRAVYPADAAQSFTLPTDQGTLAKLRKADYMVAETGPVAKPADRTLSLSFSHQMAKLTVSLAFNNQYTGNETVGAVKFYLADGTTAVTACPMEASGSTATGTTYTAILPPASYSDPALPLCAIELDGTTLVARVPATGLTLEEGKAHALTLRVGKDKLTTGTMTVNEWGGTVELEDNVADEAAGPDAATHTIRTTAEGQIADEANAGWIAEAIGTGTSLTVVGPMNEDDLKAIAAYLKSLSGTTIDLDLSDAGLTSIPELTFGGYFYDNTVHTLGQVNLPTTLTEIGVNAFRFCSSTISNWDELTSLTTIKNGAFMGSGLDGDITLPENIKTIEQMAFYQTNITSIVFPSSITTIGTQMLFRCYSLKKVVFKGDITSAGSMVFGGCYALEEIDFSACTTVPTSYEPFMDLSADDIKKIKLIVDKDLVSEFEGDQYWSKCQIVAATE